ncbi:MAG: SH3 domain-containing protein [Mogibacterium sp.]|nr:SH3 domain-containing protein [Mogibacterium sp.]
MICRYCGKKIPDGSGFCPSCGKRLEAHLRAEDREKEKKDFKYEPENEDEYEEPKGKRRLKAFISVIAAILFVAAAFIAIMVFAKPYLGEEPWPDEKKQAAEEEENIGFPKTMYISAVDGILLREEPTEESKAIHHLNYGREIQVDKIDDGWANATVDGLTGWCSSENLIENAEEIKHEAIKPKSDADKGQLVEPPKRIKTGYHGTVNSEDGLNLRCGPGEDYDILMVVPYKTEVIEEGWNEGWLYVNYDGQYGWVRSEYITPTGEVE